jgi:hypothetical protein
MQVTYNRLGRKIDGIVGLVERLRQEALLQARFFGCPVARSKRRGKKDNPATR